MLLVYDDLNLCKRILDPETKKLALEVFNGKKQLVDDIVAILKNRLVSD